MASVSEGSKYVTGRTLRERNYGWYVVFPKMESQTDFIVLHTSLHQAEMSHDVLTVQLKGAMTTANRLVAGDPVKLTWEVDGVSNTWIGYVHSLRKTTLRTSVLTNLVCVGSSYYFKNSNQRVFENCTADVVARKLASEHGLKADISSHKRVFPMISQTGQSDWQLLTRLAKQCGYGFRVDTGTLVFKPRKSLFEASKQTAPKFSFIDAPTAGLSPLMTVMRFDPMLSEQAPEVSGSNVERVISGIDSSGSNVNVSNKKTYKKYEITDSTSPHVKEDFSPVFSKIVTDEVIRGHSHAKSVVESLGNNEAYRYRASAVLAGDVNVKPYTAVYLDGVPNGMSGYWTVMSVVHKFGDSTSYVLEVTLGTDTLGDSYSSELYGVRDVASELTTGVSTAAVEYTLENSASLEKLAEVATSTSVTSSTLVLEGTVEYSTSMYDLLPAPNLSQYTDKAVWRVS